VGGFNGGGKLKRANHRWIAGLVAAGASVSATGIVFGDNWTNTAGGSWGVGTNWSNDVVPSTATFNLGSTAGYTVTLPGTETVISLVVQTDNPTLSLGGNTLLDEDEDLFPPGAPLQIAPNAGQTGSLTVIGPGTIGYGPLAVSVGGGGTGSLIINGATVNDQGPGSSLSEAAGSTITVENGGSLLQMNEESTQLTSLAGNLVLNNGIFTCEGNLGLGGLIMTNGSSIGRATNSNILATSISGSVMIDDSNFQTQFENITFGAGGSLTLTDGAYFGSGGNLTLPPITNVSSSNIYGEVTTFSGTTTVQLGSTSPPFLGYFEGSSGSYAGILDITLQNGFTPTPGEQFNIFSYNATSTGTFSSVNLPALPSPEAWNISQLYTTGVLSQAAW
jgi:hypothetical protein